MNTVRTIGTSPFRMIYGHKMFGVLPDTEQEPAAFRELLPHKPHKLKEVWDKAIEVLEKTADDTKLAYDATHQDVEYSVGDKVVILRPPKILKGTTLKFLPRWKGPFEVVKRHSALNYRVKDLATSEECTVHVQHMSIYKPWSDETLRAIVAKAQEDAKLREKLKEDKKQQPVTDEQDSSDSDFDDEEEKLTASLCSGDATKTATIGKDSFVIVLADRIMVTSLVAGKSPNSGQR